MPGTTTRLKMGMAGLACAVLLAGGAGAAHAAKAKPKAKHAVAHAAKPKPKAKPAALAPVNDKIICLETEWGQVTPQIRLVKSQECAGGAGIEVPEGVNPKAKEGEEAPKLQGQDILKFTVAKGGMFQVYGRAWWEDGCGNSFYFTFDDGGRTTISDGQYKSWHWVRGPKVHLAAGTHTLKIANSEDGAQLDQVFLTSDLVRVPVGKEKATRGAFVK